MVKVTTYNGDLRKLKSKKEGGQTKGNGEKGYNKN